MTNKRDKIKASLDHIGDLSDKSKDPVATAVYMLAAQLTSVILLASEEICEAVQKRRGFF